MEQSLEQVEVINYLEKAIEAQPKWIQLLFEKEKVVFTVTTDDFIGLKFKKTVHPLEKKVVSDMLTKYMTDHPPDFTSGNTDNVVIN